MSPSIREGDRVELTAPHIRQPRLGDAVAILVGDSLKIHRLVRLSDTMVRTSPDRGLADAPIERTRLLGVVTAVNDRPPKHSLTSKIKQLRSVWAQRLESTLA